MSDDRLTLALPKGRLFEQVQEHFESKGIPFQFEKRKLVAEDQEGLLRIFLVKNSDLPTYVQHGIAGLGVCGEDVVDETPFQFSKLLPFSFGGTRICLAGKKDAGAPSQSGSLTIATKFTKFTREYFQSRGTPVKVIKLNGSVELAPVLGLAPYIVDLVETGNTLKANGLEVIQELAQIRVHLMANPSYYKLHYKKIAALVERLREDR